MNKNTAKIKSGLRSLSHKPYEVISGTVVSGSVDTSAYTMTVQPSDDGQPIEGVRLNSATGDNNGVIAIPADNSNVVIASIDGPGEWMLVRPGKIIKAIIRIGAVTYEMDNSQVSIKNSDVEFNVSNSVFRMKTSGESLFALLKDLITRITMITVPTPVGVSSPPVNIADFNNLISRLSNLLTD